MLRRTSRHRLDLFAIRARTRDEPASAFVAATVFELLKARLHLVIKWNKHKGVVALATADPTMQVAAVEDAGLVSSSEHAPGAASLATEVPVPIFSAVELRRALNFMFKRAGWSVAVKAQSPFRLQVRAGKRALPYFRGTVATDRREQARAFIAHQINRVVKLTTRAYFDNRVLGALDDGVARQLHTFKDELFHPLLVSIQRGGQSGLDGYVDDLRRSRTA
jgi:hypothetical protein